MGRGVRGSGERDEEGDCGGYSRSKVFMTKLW